MTSACDRTGKDLRTMVRGDEIWNAVVQAESEHYAEAVLSSFERGHYRVHEIFAARPGDRDQ